MGEAAVHSGNQFGRHYMWQWKRNVDTDNVFENIFEKVKYFRKVFKYKYFLFLNYKYLTNIYILSNTNVFDPYLTYYIFELDTLLNMPPGFEVFF